MARVERLLAPNPGLFTGPGTNTYLVVSEDETLIIDPGPIDEGYQAVILEAVRDLQPTGVLVTHTHPDHAPMANPLATLLGVPAYGHAVGPEFDPDRTLADGDRVVVGTEHLEVLHTPGHADDHLCFLLGETLFTGDHIMGGSTVIVDKMGPYLRSLERLQGLELDRLYPGHGEPMDDPQAIVAEYIDHRLARERQILAAIDGGAATVGEIVEIVYADVDEAYHRMAGRSVASHLSKSVDEGLLAFDRPEDDPWDSVVRKVSS
jgi:glyoxylase-like metal-dependent hydrolase (beta-lactamase superfamily II)